MRLNTRILALILTLACLAQWAGAAEKKTSRSAAPPANIPPEVFRLIEAKEDQVKETATELRIEVSDDILDFFDALRESDWKGIQAAHRDLRRRSARNADGGPLAGVLLAAAGECFQAYEAFSRGDRKILEGLAHDLVDSIPAGSLFFAGSDPGRALATAFSKNHAKGDPFFTLTQNGFADGNYMNYLRAMYGDRIRVPNPEEASEAFSNYVQDAQRRHDHDEAHPDEPRQIRPAENIVVAKGRMSVSGQGAVMGINALIARQLIGQNTNAPIFIDHSYPLHWMYPHLSPSGPILKFSRAPLSSLAEDTIRKDQGYWQPRIDRLIGPWLKTGVSTREVCQFASRVFGDHDLTEFKGDPAYVKSDYTARAFAGLRKSIADLYAWRAGQASGGDQRKSLETAALDAFHQAFALGPSNPEVAAAFARHLNSVGRRADALLVATTTQKLSPEDPDLADLVREFRPKAE